MADALSLPMAEIAVLLGEGKLKARALAEEAIANHERFGAKLMAYSQWAPEHARKCADAADAAFAVGSRAGSLQGIPTSIKSLRRRGFSDLCRLAQAPATEIRDRRPGRRQSAPAIGDGDG
jgi:Asp-tRNA(Asn)/Glu-tRNA(Gln) amidotransferase A subunit family amidase